MKKIIAIFLLSSLSFTLISCGAEGTNDNKENTEEIVNEESTALIDDEETSDTGKNLIEDETSSKETSEEYIKRNLNDDISFSIPASWESKEFSLETGYIFLLENKYGETYTSSKDIDYENISECVTIGLLNNPDQDDTLTGIDNIQGIIDGCYADYYDITDLEFTTISGRDAAILKFIWGEDNQYEITAYVIDYEPQTAVDIWHLQNIHAASKHTEEKKEFLENVVIN